MHHLQRAAGLLLGGRLNSWLVERGRLTLLGRRHAQGQFQGRLHVDRRKVALRAGENSHVAHDDLDPLRPGERIMELALGELLGA